MNKNAQDLMMGAPTAVDKSQLDTVHIALIEE
jgi:aspartyl-tRNA synthetase